MQASLREKCEKCQTHFSELLEIGCKIVEVPENKQAGLLPQDELATHLYGCHEANRWNGKYIYYCPLGLTFVAASIANQAGTLLGGLVLDPIVMGDMQDVLYDLPQSDMA